MEQCDFRTNICFDAPMRRLARHPRRGAADRGEYREVAGAGALRPRGNKLAILDRGHVRDRAGKAPPDPGRAS